MSLSLREACQRAVHVITTDGQTLSGGRAVLFVLAELGYARRLMACLTRAPIVWLVEAGYRLVAHYRGTASKFLR